MPTAAAPCMLDYGALPDCAAGTMPTMAAPCKFDMPDCAEGQRPSEASPCKPAPCPEGVQPTQAKPCRPGGEDGAAEGEGFDAPPTSSIQKEMKSKYMVVNLLIEGSGDANGSFDVTFSKVVSGVSTSTVGYLNEQLEGDSFVINTTSKTSCFADTKDPDKIPDLVPCKQLDEIADSLPGSVKAQFRGKVTFDAATYEPVWNAKKIVFLKGSYNITKIS